MKKLGVLLPLLLVLLIVSSCISLGSLFPNVQSPNNSESSLLVVEAGVPGEGALFNANASGWAPWWLTPRETLSPLKPLMESLG
jgi:hypothetical protein